MATVDPHSRHAARFRRDVIVEQALGYVQKPLAREAHRIHLPIEGVEVAERWLVGADALGGENRIERDTEFLVARRETTVVHIGQDDECEVLREPLQRLVRIWERGPVGYRGSQEVRVVIGYINPQRLP